LSEHLSLGFFTFCFWETVDERLAAADEFGQALFKPLMGGGRSYWCGKAGHGWNLQWTEGHHHGRPFVIVCGDNERAAGTSERQRRLELPGYRDRSITKHQS
jgi:hypothetical protein